MASARIHQLETQLSHHATNSSQSDASPSPYKILEQPLGTARHVRIVGIGAGMSGINMIRTLRIHLTNFEHVVYEKNPKIGGTWFENRYPGCKCDIPSHNYQFSWRPNPDWSSFFSPASEIQDYLSRVCDEEDMHSVIKTAHQVTNATWDDSETVWRLRVTNLRDNTEFDDYCHFLLDATGILNHCKWPEIPGLHTFKGDVVHSANWPEEIDFNGKTVALIGNGSSGVQILPAIQPLVKQLVHFVREPTWIVPSRLQLLAEGQDVGIFEGLEMNADGTFTDTQIAKFKSYPEYYRQFVKAVEEVVNNNFPLTLKDSEFAKGTQQAVASYMREALNDDKRLCDAMIPDFPLGCRRLTPGVGYLEALQASNVTVVTESIVEIRPEGLIMSSGEMIKVNAIVCATGFNVSFCPRFPIVGPQGNLQDIWTKQLPKAYMSFAVPGFPNYFTFLGPNAPIGHGSVFTITEHIGKYLAQVIKKCQTVGIRTISPSQAVVDELFEHTQTFMPRTAWSGSCISWFKSGTKDGPVTALHPGSRIHFFHMLKAFRGEDWEYSYINKGNRFQYLGNGISILEGEDADSTWYLDRPDEL